MMNLPKEKVQDKRQIYAFSTDGAYVNGGEIKRMPRMPYLTLPRDETAHGFHSCIGSHVSKPTASDSKLPT